MELAAPQFDSARLHLAGHVRPVSGASKIAVTTLPPFSGVKKTVPATSGAVVVLTVTARNATGESPVGNAVEIAVP
ncbi:MAG TPA: hypothetical protein VF437_09825 [Verrucomicrobiae bacterium]